MIVSFSLNNFRSFKDEVIFEMSPGNSRKKNDHIIPEKDVLKVATIFGGNGSGKSNLIMGLKTLKKIITNNYYTSHFPLYNWENESKITTFDIQFISDETLYHYKIDVESIGDNSKKPRERLFSYVVKNELLQMTTIGTDHLDGTYDWKDIINSTNYGSEGVPDTDITNIAELHRLLLENEKLKDKNVEDIDNVGDVFKKVLSLKDKVNAENKDEYKKDIKKLNDDIRKYSKNITERQATIEHNRFELERKERKIEQYRSMIFRQEYDPNKVLIDEYRYGVIAKTVLNWFSSTLVVLETDDYTIPLNQDYLLDNLSSIVSSLDVGIDNFEWTPLKSDDFAHYILSLIGENDIRRLKICKETSIRQSSLSSITLKIDGTFYKFTYWIGEEKIYRLDVKNKKSKRSLSMSSESDGTIRAIELASILLPTKGDKVYIIDELNRRLHPLMTRRIVEQMLDDKSNKKQLIFTTHETHLMTTDLFRRDEIWVVDKIDGRSQIAPLDQIKGLTNDTRLDIQYLEKKMLGGVPLIDRKEGY